MPHVEIEGSVSVTQIQGILNKPALYHWYAKKEREGFLLNPDIEYWTHKKSCSFRECFCEARKEKEATAGTGTDIHARLEEYFRSGEITPETEDFVAAYKPLGTEVVVFEPEEPYRSKKHHYHGSFDLLDKDNLGYIINDFKITNSVYKETKLQLAAYAQLIIEKHGITWDDISRGRVWNIDRETGKLRWYKGKPYREVTHLEKYFKVFKSLILPYQFSKESDTWC